MRVSDEKLHVEQQSGAGLQAHGQGQERTKLQYAGLSGVRYGKMGHLIAERSHRLARYPVSSAVPLRRRKVSAERNSRRQPSSKAAAYGAGDAILLL